MPIHWREIQGEPKSPRYGLITGGADEPWFHPLHRAAHQSLGLPHSFESIAVPYEDLEEGVPHLQSLGYRGLFVCHPHKVGAARLASKYFVARAAVGTANTLLLKECVYAQNTEVTAIAKLVENVQPDTALVLGSTHAARAVMSALLEQKWKIKVWNRNLIKSRLMKTTFSRFGDVEATPTPDPTGCTLVVNATPIGMKPGEKPPLEWRCVRPKTVFMDMLAKRIPTEFLREASNRGLRGIDGRECLVEQVMLTYQWWDNLAPDRNTLRREVGLRPLQ